MPASIRELLDIRQFQLPNGRVWKSEVAAIHDAGLETTYVINFSSPTEAATRVYMLIYPAIQETDSESHAYLLKLLKDWLQTTAMEHRHQFRGPR